MRHGARLAALVLATLFTLGLMVSPTGAQVESDAYVDDSGQESGGEVSGNEVLSASTPAPEVKAGGLAFTGSEVTTLALAGGALIILGGGAVVVSRRRAAA